MPDALIQPIPADEVAAAVARTALAEPIDGIVNIGGPMKITFEQMAHEHPVANRRRVVHRV